MIFSYSKIMDAYKCYRLFKLKHIDGIKEDMHSADLAFGSAMHFAIENMLKPNHEVGLPPQEVFTLVWEKAANDDKTVFGRLDKDTLTKRGLELLRKFEKSHAKLFKPAYIEERYDTKIGEHDFTGKADFVGEYEGIPSIVDFKTSAYAYKDDRKINSDEQMAAYAYLMEKETGYKIKQIVYKVLCKDESTRIQTQKKMVTEEWIAGMLSNTKLMMDDLSNRTEFPMNRYSCLNCSFFNVCYGKKE